MATAFPSGQCLGNKAGVMYVVKTRMLWDKILKELCSSPAQAFGRMRMSEVTRREKTASNLVDGQSLSTKPKDAMNEHFPEQ